MKRSRLFLASLCAAILFLVAMPSQAAAWKSLDGATSTGAGIVSNFENTPGAQVHVYSTAGSSATVVVQGAMTSSGPWLTLCTITNPSATGEACKGTAWPYMRGNVTARSSGALTASFQSLTYDPGAWTSSIAGSSTTAPTYGVIKYTWTNAEIVALGGGTSGTITIGTLPANSQLLSAYAIVGTQATFAAGTLTLGVGRTSATFVDFLAAGDLKAAAGTVYGNAAAERATDAAIQHFATATTVKAIVTAGAGDLANVTGSTGTIYLLYVVFP